MGLLSTILGLPLAPVRGTTWIAERVLSEAERQHFDPGTIRTQLEDIAAARASGTMSHEEATALEAELVGRLIDAGRRTNQGG